MIWRRDWIETDTRVNSGDAEDKFRIYQPILSIMGKMTPREFIVPQNEIICKTIN